MGRSICLPSHLAYKVQNTKNIWFISLSFIVTFCDIFCGHFVVDEYSATGNKENTCIRRQGFGFVGFLGFSGGFFCGFFVVVGVFFLNTSKYFFSSILLLPLLMVMTSHYFNNIQIKNSDIQSQAPLSHAILLKKNQNKQLGVLSLHLDFSITKQHSSSFPAFLRNHEDKNSTVFQ